MRLVAQIHDELLLEVNPQLCDVYLIAGKQFKQPLSVMQAFCNWNALNCSSCIYTALMHGMGCCMPGCLHLSQDFHKKRQGMQYCRCCAANHGRRCVLEGPTDSQCQLWAAVGSYAAHVTGFNCKVLTFIKTLCTCRSPQEVCRGGGLHLPQSTTHLRLQSFQ